MLHYLKDTYPEDAAAVFGAVGVSAGALSVAVTAPNADASVYLNEVSCERWQAHRVTQ